MSSKVELVLQRTGGCLACVSHFSSALSPARRVVVPGGAIRGSAIIILITARVCVSGQLMAGDQRCITPAVDISEAGARRCEWQHAR